MKQYVDLDEVVTVYNDTPYGQTIATKRTIADILYDLGAEYTPLEAYEIEEEEE